MGQGYATKERQQYIPAEPASTDDAPLQFDEHPGNQTPEQLQAQQKLAASRRQSKMRVDMDPDAVRSASINPNGRGGAAGHNDGEWMYNLDQLANEHAKRKRKSIH